ncbi:MAG: hypothetical protein AAGA75_22970 [Cyanobacteria bacterium P01_E01_bin.6]
MSNNERSPSLIRFLKKIIIDWVNWNTTAINIIAAVLSSIAEASFLPVHICQVAF